VDIRTLVGIISSAVAAGCDFGAAKSKTRDLKAALLSVAVGAGTTAVSCFTAAAQDANRELATPKEYRQLPSHSHWIKVSKVPVDPSRDRN